MAYVPNWLSGKNGYVLLGMGGTGMSVLPGIIGPASISGATSLPNALSLGGSYTTTWAFGKWRFPVKTATPKVTNFTGVTAFATPGGVGLANNAPNGPNAGVFTLAFQQVVAGVTSGTVQLDGPHDQGNMPLVSGVQYAFLLGLSGISGPLAGAFGMATLAIISNLEPFVDVEGANMIRVTAESNGYFTPYVL